MSKKHGFVSPLVVFIGIILFGSAVLVLKPILDKQLSGNTSPIQISKNTPELKVERYIVSVKTNPEWQPEGDLSEQETELQREAIQKSIDQVVEDLEIIDKVTSKFTIIPSFVVVVSESELEQIKNHPLVKHVEKDIALGIN